MSMYGKKKSKWDHFVEALNLEDPEVGTTYRTAVWKKGKATVWYYPTQKKKFKEPVFLVYSLVNQPYVLDLGPSMSLIEAFTRAGYDMYLMDFGIPGYEDRDISMDDYITKYLIKGYQRALRHAQMEEMSVMGFCLGGTLTAMFASITKEKIKNLILAVAPLDFTTFPVYDKWLEALRNDEFSIDELIDTVGLIPPAALESGMRLVAAPISYSQYLSLLNRSDEPVYQQKWIRMNKWTSDHVPVSGETFKQLINELGRDNKLIKSELYIHNERVDLANINMPLFVVTTSFDILVPNYLTKPIMDVVSSEDKTYCELQGGHASLTLSDKVPEPIEKWLAEHSTPIN